MSEDVPRGACAYSRVWAGEGAHRGCHTAAGVREVAASGRRASARAVPRTRPVKPTSAPPQALRQLAWLAIWLKQAQWYAAVGLSEVETAGSEGLRGPRPSSPDDEPVAQSVVTRVRGGRHAKVANLCAARRDRHAAARAASRSAATCLRQPSRRSDGARLFCAHRFEHPGGEVDRLTSRTPGAACRARRAYGSRITRGTRAGTSAGRHVGAAKVADEQLFFLPILHDEAGEDQREPRGHDVLVTSRIIPRRTVLIS